MPTITRDSHRVGAEPVTERQAAFVRKLARERVFPRLGSTRAERLTQVESLITSIDKMRMTTLIGQLVGSPFDKTPDAEADAEKLTAGVYEVNGEIFNIKWNKAKTNLYAQRLVELPNVDRLTESGDVVHIEFEYAPGVVHRVRPHHKMPLERARELTIRYGRCLACGRRLKNAESVERGIGPVCRKAFAA